MAIRFNLLQICASVSPSVLAMLVTPSFHILSSDFYGSLSLVTVTTV